MVIHVVRAGETLWQISNQYGVDMDNVILLNGLPNPDQLLIGQSLVIPVPETSYIVKSGDTLWSISQRFGVSMHSIIQSNQLVNPHFLTPGTRLLILTTIHVVQTGET